MSVKEGKKMAKAKMICVSVDELAEMKLREHELDTPTLHHLLGGAVYADADELRAWREKRASTHQSEAEA